MEKNVPKLSQKFLLVFRRYPTVHSREVRSSKNIVTITKQPDMTSKRLVGSLEK